MKSRTWVVKPETTKTHQLRKQKHNIAYEKNNDSIENYVQHLHTSVAVLTKDIIKESHVYGSNFRMNSVNRPANFKIFSNKTVSSPPYLVFDLLPFLIIQLTYFLSFQSSHRYYLLDVN